ncbi:hypothetical protein [Lacisediminihabitans profunda]|uniref:Uncharacterized protein n=1 Tax=Lacisediminihabitans profunda TaxID=2594790 RepID=A0A5C8URY1_9MICO|nr:hypothetical protein [Lacisediminihabitans profunda]TXN31275.1 hypothetical protein FVP33_06820 [Lacisediminihabitans profunda]
MTIAAVAMLTGCVRTEPIASPPPTSAPTPAATPLFASDAEALAAATAAYAAYVAMSDKITTEGGADPERISPYVSKEQLARDLAVFKTYEDRGYASHGELGFDSVRLESLTGTDKPVVTVFLCADFSKIRLVDSAGTDITESDLQERAPMEISFVRDSNVSTRYGLVIDWSESWSGTDFCAG